MRGIGQQRVHAHLLPLEWPRDEKCTLQLGVADVAASVDLGEEGCQPGDGDEDVYGGPRTRCLRVQADVAIAHRGRRHEAMVEGDAKVEVRLAREKDGSAADLEGEPEDCRW